MRRLLIVTACASLAACANLSPLLAPPSAQVLLSQGRTTLDLSYNVAAKLYLADLPTMRPAVHDSVKPILLRAYKLVSAVDTGTVLAGEASLSAEIADASLLVGQVRTLLAKA